MRIVKFLALLSTLTLMACGGGGGDGSNGPVVSANSFDIQSGWTRLIANGYTKTLTVSGSCSGTYTVTQGAATTGATFENTVALSSNNATSMTLTNCSPASSVDTAIDYYDSNYRPLGYSAVDGDYAVWTGTPALPTAAKVSDVATVGSANRYASSSKVTPRGRQDATLVMEPDTATTAIANLVLKYYTTSNVLEQTQQQRFRVAADGSLTLISIDVQFANGSTTHLVMN
ncbi:hypothetical protein [Limnohabitans sp. B9-3]|uniref:hypothetical protein n=1 Tax=Limnohabitans sp. B9-3 TaxID=1100707 RepID=UPI001179EF0F|nr:hypothetical protein [Limnohabitans sp. B9-3]